MMETWKRDFASGLIILFPLLVITVLFAWVYSKLLVLIPERIRIDLTQTVGKEWQWLAEIISELVSVALILLVFVLLVFSVGYLMRTAIGAVLEAALDDLMNSLPGLRVVYKASKMAVETALSGSSELQEPVRLEVWDGLRMTAFKTGNQTADGRDILFLPTAPNITTGFVIEVESDRYTEIDDNVEDALVRVLSAGFGDDNDSPFSGMIQNDQQVSVDDLTGETDETDE